jgi:hypothetical protein
MSLRFPTCKYIYENGRDIWYMEKGFPMGGLFRLTLISSYKFTDINIRVLMDIFEV